MLDYLPVNYWLVSSSQEYFDLVWGTSVLSDTQPFTVSLLFAYPAAF